MSFPLVTNKDNWMSWVQIRSVCTRHLFTKIDCFFCDVSLVVPDSPSTIHPAIPPLSLQQYVLLLGQKKSYLSWQAF